MRLGSLCALCNVRKAVAEEIAYENGWITRDQLLEAAEKYGKSPYGQHLKSVAENRIISQPSDDPQQA